MRRPLPVCRVSLVTLAALAVAAAAETYRPPAAWPGAKAGAADGNPVLAAGKPLWRLDRLWPDDPMDADAYRPLVWNGERWSDVEHEHGGQPAVAVADGKVSLSSRAAWAGRPGQKLPALVFIAPESGTYAVEGRATASAWEGGVPVLRVLKRDPKTGRVGSCLTLHLKNKEPVDLAPLSLYGIRLEAGQELVLVPWYTGGWNSGAANVTVEGLALGPSAGAPTAAQALEGLFGDALKRAAATRERADDVALAGRLLETARDADALPDLVAVLCEKACALAAGEARGLPIALAASELLVNESPDRGAAAQETLLGIWRRQYETARGDARLETAEALIDALLAAAAAHARAGSTVRALRYVQDAQRLDAAVGGTNADRIEAENQHIQEVRKAVGGIPRLQGILAAQPDNRQAREELVRLYLVELDNPHQAARFLDPDCDRSLRRYVPAAAKGIDAAPELACPELAAWYAALADQARGPGKVAMLMRAQAYYARFVDLHKPADAERRAAADALKKVEDTLQALGGTPERPVFRRGQWVDVLRLADPGSRTAGKGTWTRQPSGLLAAGEGALRIALPVMPADAYEVEVKFIRKMTGSVAVILPVGQTQAMLLLEKPNGYSGLEMIDNQGCDTNGTKIASGRLVNEQMYTVAIQVTPGLTQTRITVTLNGKPYITWSGQPKSLSVAGGWRLPQAGCVGLAISGGQTLFRSVRLRVLSGEAALLPRR